MYRYVNKRAELAQRGIALQKMYVLLFYYYYDDEDDGSGGDGSGWC